MSAVIIRYSHPEVGDSFIVPRNSGLPGGAWCAGIHGGEEAAIVFKNEGCAKSFLNIHNYDLPAMKVTFQPASA